MSERRQPILSERQKRDRKLRDLEDTAKEFLSFMDEQHVHLSPAHPLAQVRQAFREALEDEETST